MLGEIRARSALDGSLVATDELDDQPKPLTRREEILFARADAQEVGFILVAKD